MIDFKDSHYLKSVVLYAVFFYLLYPVSYRDLEEIMAERGDSVDHATLNRWGCCHVKLGTVAHCNVWT